jgi:hypothetical protein
LQELILRKYLKQILYKILLSLTIFLITACNNNNDAAVKTIVSYINALSNKDTVQIANLSCSGWEQDALAEVDSLTSVGSTVENLSCQISGQEGNDVYISCTGQLALDYNGEAQQIDLSTRTYIARQEDGEWRMCGYH